MAHILVIEDEPDIASLLENFLSAQRHDITIAQDGVQGISLFQKARPDLVLLDIMLPKIDGYGVLEVIRGESDVPVMMLTALDSEENQIRGFDLQADDYVTKPFSMPVLVRKVEAVLRRTGGNAAEPDTKVAYGALLLYPQAYRVTMDGAEIPLTHREFALLRTLLENRGRVLTREMLLQALWGYDFFGDARVVDTHIKNLRRKLEADFIQTIRGVGYRID